jgi:hypothetical protein
MDNRMLDLTPFGTVHKWAQASSNAAQDDADMAVEVSRSRGVHPDVGSAPGMAAAAVILIEPLRGGEARAASCETVCQGAALRHPAIGV